MVDAIVYYSKHGSVKQIATVASEYLGVPLYTIKEAKNCLLEKTEILYFGPLRGTTLMRYGRIRDFAVVRGVCAVGILPETILTSENIKNENLIYKPIFYTRGSLDVSSLSWLEKLKWRYFMKNIMKYDEIYYDTSANLAEIKENIVDKPFLNYIDFNNLFKWLSQYKELSDTLVN